MIGANPWELGGEWLKGSFHCHSTNSDGKLAPQALADRFHALGCDFLGISDHDRITDVSSLDGHGMCLVPAVEVTAPVGEFGEPFHLLTLGARSLPPAGTPAAQAARFLRGQGAAVFAAHAYWSGLTVPDLLGVELDGLEIYNGATHLISGKGESLAYWDEMLRRGVRLWGAAGDDTHYGTLDVGLAWLHVRAAARTPEAILEAVRAGRFYASAGPEIYEVRREGTTLHVRCSPCLAVYCLSFGPRTHIAFDTAAMAGRPPGTITEATFHLSGSEPFVRLQLLDAHRRPAWSNPL